VCGVLLTQRMPRARGVCAVCVCVCVGATARGGRHIFTSQCLPLAPGGFVGIFIYFIFFPLLISWRNGAYLHVCVYLYIIEARCTSCYITLYYIIKVSMGRGNWLPNIISYLYIRILNECFSTPFARAIRTKSSSSCCCCCSSCIQWVYAYNISWSRGCISTDGFQNTRLHYVIDPRLNIT